MNVFVIPSSYPHPGQPTAGIFVRDQALALGALRPDWRVAISLWGQGEWTIPLRQPELLPRLLQTVASGRRERRRSLRENVVEYRRPVLTWSRRALGGRQHAIVDSNVRNLAAAGSELGTIDLIHAHFSYPAGWVASELSRRTRIPYVITEHSAPFPLPGLGAGDGLPAVVAEPLEHAAVRIAVSAALARSMELQGVEDVTVVSNLIDESFFRPEDRRRGGQTVFFTLGSMVREAGMDDRKGIGDLLDAAAKVDAPFELRIAGPGDDRAFRHRARQLGLENRVVWLGPLTREESLEQYQACDCFVLASRHESFGLVFAEALACGRPVIATRCGGPEEIVTPEDGLLVDPSSTVQLADALRAMIGASARYDSEAIRGRCLERFSRAVIVAEIEDAYRRALAPANAAASAGGER